MKLRKKSDQVTTDQTSACAPARDEQSYQTDETKGRAISRREFLRNSGLAAGGVALATGLSPGMMKKAQASTAGKGKVKEIKTVCTHCSVGCGIIAEVQNGVWTGQEPAFDHPFNRGAHCAKGASVREHGHGERRKCCSILRDGAHLWYVRYTELRRTGFKLQECGPHTMDNAGILDFDRRLRRKIRYSPHAHMAT